MIRVERVRVLNGPNIHHHEPVVVAVVDTAGVAMPEPAELRRRLVALLPGVAGHLRAAGSKGGLRSEIDDGANAAQLVERVAIELSHRAGIGVDFGRTMPAERPGRFTVVVRATASQAMAWLVEQASALVAAVIAGATFDLERAIDEARNLVATTELGPGLRAIVRAAAQRGIPAVRIGDQRLVQLGYGRHRRLVRAAGSDGERGVELDGDPDHAGHAPGHDGVPVPSGIVDIDEAVAAAGTHGAAIVDRLFAGTASARVPIVAITGTNGKTTVTRMIDHVLRASGLRTGMTTTDGISIGGQEVMRGDTTGPYSAQVVLGDPTVEIAVLETARGGIVRRGLGYDWTDVGVITNVAADHIGQDGIKSVDDLLEVKALIAERVRPGGTVVLNADDPRLVALASRRSITPSRRIVFFSLDADNPVVMAHVAAGGTAYVLDHGEIARLVEDAKFRVASVAMLPITMGGVAAFQAANAMAAIAACHALTGIEPASAARALSTFRSDRHNPGRMNLFAVNGGYVLIDYGHNPDAFETMSRLASQWHGRRRTGIVGVPGDRDDATIRASGRIVGAAFDRIVLREDHDLRGRHPGETSAMLGGEIAAAYPGVACTTVLDERDALAEAIDAMEPGEVVVIFYEKLEHVMGVLHACDATPVDAVPTGAGQEVAQ